MGSKPVKSGIPTGQELSRCYELMKEADKMFDSDVLNVLLSQPPLSTHFLNKLVLKKTEKSRIYLQEKLVENFPISNHSYATFITLHLSRCRSKTGYFEYINSMRSLHYLHKTKEVVLLKDFLKHNKPKVQVIDSYLKEIKGNFSLQGLCELEQLIDSSIPAFIMFMSLFRQTFESKKILDSEFQQIKNIDKSELIPAGFGEAQDSVEGNLYNLQFPNIYY